MDAIFTAAVLLGLFAAPLVGAGGLASTALSWLRAGGVRTNRWMVLPFLLIAFSLICYAVSLWTLAYAPGDPPAFLGPILVFLLIDSLFLLPVAVATVLRGLMVIRQSKSEAVLHFVATALFAFLFFPYSALQDYFPQV